MMHSIRRRFGKRQRQLRAIETARQLAKVVELQGHEALARFYRDVAQCAEDKLLASDLRVGILGLVLLAACAAAVLAYVMGFFPSLS